MNGIDEIKERFNKTTPHTHFTYEPETFYVYVPEVDVKRLIDRVEQLETTIVEAVECLDEDDPRMARVYLRLGSIELDKRLEEDVSKNE